MDSATPLRKLHESQAPAEPQPALERALETIAGDARQRPQDYLEDTRVPEGGE